MRRYSSAAQGAVAQEAATGHSQKRQTGAKPTRTDETCRIFWNGSRDVAQLFRAVLCTVRRHIERRTGRLPSDGEALDAMFEHVFEAWSTGLGVEKVRAAHRVFARDGCDRLSPAPRPRSSP